jgi:PST family polysaccharide transporter
MRLVRPEYFGLIAMVNIVVVFLDIFKSVSTEVALIQKKEAEEAEISSLFWFNVFIGLFLALLMVFLSPVISSFYKEKGIFIVCLYFAATLFFNGFNTIPISLLYKKMDFKMVFWMELTRVGISGAVAVLMALRGSQMESLLTRIVLLAFLPLIFWILFINWKPVLSFRWRDVNPHLRFGLPVLADNLLNFCVRNLDDLLVGKFLGKAQLGIYNRGYSLLLFPLSTFSSAVARVILPLFSSSQNDLDYIKVTYLKTTRMLAFLTFPLMLFVFLCAEPLIFLLLGAEWKEMEPLIQIFAVLGAAQSIGTLDGAVYQSLGKTAVQLKVGIITKVFMVSMILTGFALYKSILGVAIFYTIGSFFAGLWGWHYLGKLFGAQLSDMLKNLAPVLLVTLLSGFLISWVIELCELNGERQIVFVIVSEVIILIFAGRILLPETISNLGSILKTEFWKS